MHVQVLQHVPFEGVGSMADWFQARGATLHYTRFYEADARLPDPASCDLIVAMGGPMSVNDESELPWLIEEKAFLRQAIENGVPVLGICLGAQLIASALGARVQPNTVVEIGWFPVWRAESVGEGCFVFPDRIELLHWHGETFELPAGATLLASSEACPHQAFQLGRRVIGLQCHPEMTPAIVADLLDACADELSPGPWVQTPAQLAGEPRSYLPGNVLMTRVLDYLLVGR
ncbi:type 1 glutamine amidotransferase [Pseudomonas chengduensis]|jgi:GMP synthase-like glutamine amidotransferase|nr:MULTISPECIES: type 1 glutamine amidotransferase [Pseudomonas]MDH0621853.1 type 1 glutamine amidotransferase [Pseudomonas chengduensis]MDH1664123.1 type 1 glutamine amidotransferase [Pseudomonas chengduensis]MDH1680841.1 type 1 glutamine amidotransferase [Pseudomonas chengduensis]MDM9651425.1 type 1 glutamine amidotransferase [Pseudomonas wenzhouensis]